MNEPLDWMEQLARRARLDVPETPDSVADAVLRRLRKPERTPLMWLALGTAAATLVLAVFSGMPLEDPDSLDLLFETASFIEVEGEL